MGNKIILFFISAIIFYSCSKRDKYQEFYEDKQQQTENKETPRKKYDTSKKQIPKPEKTVSALEAAEYIGKFVNVRGHVAEVTKRERVEYLNFVEFYPKSPFIAVIFAGSFEEFGDISVYLYKEVEVAGLVSTYKGTPQIILNTKDQIKIIK